MKIVVNKADLSRAINATISLVARRATMPILSNFLISASDKKLEIFASDTDLSAVARVPAKVEKAGSTTVSAKILADVVRELPDSDVNIQLTSNEKIEISCAGSRFKLNGISSAEYPSLPGMALKGMIRVPANVISDAIALTLYSASMDETRFNLNGVCFESNDSAKALTFTATDGHRMAMVTRSLKGLNFKGKQIVPRRGLLEIKKILSGVDAEIGIAMEEGFFILETDEIKYSLRLIDGEFPDCSQVISKTPGFKATIRAADLAAPLRRMMLVVSDKEKGVRLTFGDNELQLESSSPNLGEAGEKVSLEYQGKSITMGANAQYLLEAVQSFGDDSQICLEIYGELSPVKISRSGDESGLAIVMPMRI
jgi:DNA polymerase-3 subunit beta